MEKFVVAMPTVSDVKKFCDSCAALDFEVDVLHGHYVLDAKSIMSLLSLDLSKSVEVKPSHDLDEKQLAELKEAIKEFRV